MRKRNIKQKEVSVVTVKEKLICFNNQHMEQGKDEPINNFSTSKYSIIKEKNIDILGVFSALSLSFQLQK